MHCRKRRVLMTNLRWISTNGPSWLMLPLMFALLALVAFPSGAPAQQTDLLVGVNKSMHATLIAPDGDGAYPGVLVLHTSGGLEGADIAFAQALVKAGYVALVPAFLQAYGITGRTRIQTFTADADPIYADLVAALDTLAHDPRVSGRKLGAVGFSNGGYFAMWLAATGKVQAGVSYYGALSGAGTDKDLVRFKSVFNRTSSPVLILHGLDDGTVPVGAARKLGALVTAAGSPVEVHLYDGAGHRFERTPGSQPDTAAAADAWQQTLAFLAKSLKP